MLSGNRANPIKNSAGRDDKNHTIIYRLDDLSSNPDINLTRGGFILIGLMSGGDYHQAGLPGCGIKTAHALAKCGFGESLYEAAKTHPPHALPAVLKQWRDDLRQELRTNSQGHLGRKYVALAKAVPDTFPDIDILLSYTNPITSQTEGRARNQLTITWDREPDLGRLANTCELYFEWGVKPIIIKRFRTVIWPSAVLRILRRAVLERDRTSQQSPPSTPMKTRKEPVVGSPSKAVMNRFSKMQLEAPTSDDEDDARMFVKIHSSRTHASTDGILEYRLEVHPAPLVRLCIAGIAGIRPPIKEDEWADEDDGDDEKEGNDGKATTNPLQSLRVWMPASMVRVAEPGLVMEFENAQEKKQARKTKKKNASKTKAVSETTQNEDASQDRCPPKAQSATRKSKVVRKKPQPPKQPAVSEDDAFSHSDRLPDPPPQTSKDIKSFFAVSKRVNVTTHASTKTASRPIPKKCVTTSKTIEWSETEASPEAPSASTSCQGSSLHPSTARSPSVSPVISRRQDPEALNNARPEARYVHTKLSRKKSQATSDSDSYQSQLKKSPRKSTQQNSPRRSKALFSGESDDDGFASRPVSPSPLRGRMKELVETIIEISSDSDDLSTALDMKPLLVARARRAKAKDQLMIRKSANRRVGTNKAASQEQSLSLDEIVDLT